MAPGNVAQRLTIYTGSSQTWDGVNLALAIIERCRVLKIAGATVTRGIAGFGHHSRIHRAHLLGLSDDLPEKVEVIDTPEQIMAVIADLNEMIGTCLVIVEEVQVIRSASDRPGGPTP